jgi:hypothetical protein
MRRIRVGDRVQAFMDSNIKGSVTSIEYEKSTAHMIGGTAGSIAFCIIKTDDGRMVRYKSSELFHVD